MKKVGEIQVELVFSQPPGKSTGAAIVPADALDALEAQRTRFKHEATWWYVPDPRTGESRPAFTPIGGGRLQLILDQGIRHGDRFLAKFDINEVERKGKTKREMWFIEARTLGR